MTARIKYTQKLADAICELVSECVPVHKIAKHKGMPARTTIYQWLAEIPAFADQYTRAREMQADRLVDECIGIADTEKDKMGAVDRDRLRIQTRQWKAERMAPKKYGARNRTELTGADGGAIETRARVDLSGVSDVALAELERALASGR